MPQLVVRCVEALDGIAVHPCGTYQGVAMVPDVQDDTGQDFQPDFTQSPQLFAWAFSMVLMAWMLGLTIGKIMRVIRSA